MSTATISPPASPQIGAHSDLLALLLADQQELSAVEQFARLTEEDTQVQTCSQYQALLPLTPLTGDEQYAFSVDLDRCSGCKACVTACHNMNGLDEEETWRDVGLLYSSASQRPVMQHITSACHHCVDPACMKACPTNSYEKDPLTGIVRHLDDQCFGCQYCTLACPYGVPKYHADKGIVRKCDLCSQRLSQNEPPACVQACPHEAISITKVSRQQAREKAAAGEFLTGAHRPAYTIPTTIYHSAKLQLDDLVRGDAHMLHPEHAHWPLILMLTLIQLSVGGFLGLACLQGTEVFSLAVTRWIVLVLFGISQAALGFATLHLGRPLYAFRGILGFTHSWMSREIVGFGLFSAAAGTYLASLWVPEPFFPFAEIVQHGGPVLAALTGYLGLFCSVMIYQCTERAYWNGFDTTVKFMGTTLVSGAAFLLAALSLSTHWFPNESTAATSLFSPMIVALIACNVLKTGLELLILRHHGDSYETVLKQSARLLLGPLRTVVQLRIAISAMITITATLLFLLPENVTGVTAAVSCLALLTLVLLGEVTERYLFFTAVVAPRMPGGMA